ncbi:uncharacterized protein LOC135499427 [Lineus longissimus]|uniref:uncharacterized protein LOC135499427 n=1 Tax=Lineus longissimus TaxID=88925 RepID=UPI00315D2DA5
MDCLATFIEVAEKKGWTYFLAFGSLLGSWRHHGMILWDGDVDVYVNISHRDDIIKTFNNTDYTPQQMFSPRKIVKLYSTLSTLNTSYIKEGLGWWMWPYLDIFFFTEDATHIHNVESSARIEKSDVFPLHERPFGSLWVPCPKNTFKVLKEAYGKEESELCKGYTTEVNCQLLKDLVPFVHRQVVNGALYETLKLGNRTLAWQYIKNETVVVTSPYDFGKVESP